MCAESFPDPNLPAAAVVGARGCSEYGIQLAQTFAELLAKEQVQIISGLALRIDGAAHRGALRAGADTYGVFGCGVNICYPSAHYKLYGQMLTQGGIILNFPLDTGPLPNELPHAQPYYQRTFGCHSGGRGQRKERFPDHGRAGPGSGKRDFCRSGKNYGSLSGGCNRLIQQGAHMAISPNDILEYLGVKCGKRLIIHEKNANALAKPEKMVYACLDFKAKHLEKISDQCSMSISECMGILLELELQGYVFRTANHYYGKKI